MATDIKLPRNLSFRHVRAFVCLAHYGSFTQAAEALSMSQPALTLNIHQFEEMVGVPLFNRTTRSVFLTRLGAEFLPMMEELLNHFGESVQTIRQRAQQQDNQIDIALLPSIAIRVLPIAIREFSEQQPEANIQMHDDNSRGVQAQVLNGQAEIGISNIWEQHPDLEFTPFISDRVGLICRENHALTKLSEPLSWSDLDNQDFVGMTDDTGINRMMRQISGLPSNIQNPAYSVLTISALVGLVDGGQAITALPALASPDYLTSTLVYRDISEPVMHRHLCLITARNRPLSQQASLFKAFILDSIPNLCSMFPNNTVIPYSS